MYIISLTRWGWWTWSGWCRQWCWNSWDEDGVDEFVTDGTDESLEQERTRRRTLMDIFAVIRQGCPPSHWMKPKRYQSLEVKVVSDSERVWGTYHRRSAIRESTKWQIDRLFDIVCKGPLCLWFRLNSVSIAISLFFVSKVGSDDGMFHRSFNVTIPHSCMQGFV